MNSYHRHHTVSIWDTVLNCFDFLRWKGSVLPTVLPQAFLASFLAAIIWYVDFYVYPIAITNSVAPNILMVLGMLFGFRTNSAYERFYEGRKLWTELKAQCRNLSRYLLLFIPESELQGKKSDKTTAVRLVAAYMYSCKALLRDELNTTELEPNLESLLPADLIEKFRSPLVLPVRSNSTDCYFDQLLPNVLLSEVVIGKGKQLPAAIILRLNQIIQYNYCKNKVIDAQCHNMMNTVLGSMANTLASLERIAATPIPLAYRLHLTQSLWCYLIVLPFATVRTANVWVILVQMIVSFTLFGIIAIGAEIENPFGYDNNDLPLDSLCSELRDEVLSLLQRV